MNEPLRIVEFDALRAVLTPEAVVAGVHGALIRHARGETLVPPPVQMMFENPPGDCHVKAGGFVGGDRFVVKIATGAVSVSPFWNSRASKRSRINNSGYHRQWQ
jgi:ornithine cyclodeaminase/alanine dehydrogenase-like protein (mu-crystallin family)